MIYIYIYIHIHIYIYMFSFSCFWGGFPPIQKEFVGLLITTIALLRAITLLHCYYNYYY